MKKILISLLCILLAVLAVSCNPIPSEQPDASSFEPAESSTPNEEIQESPAEDFEYELASDKNSVYITKYIGDSEDVVIPSKINGLTVVSLKGISKEEGSYTYIYEGVFENCNIKTVVIPSSIKSIGYKAFMNCTELVSVEFLFGDNLEFLLERAFDGCKKLESLDLSSSKLLYIEEYSFINCSGLKEIKLPDSIISIGNEAFYECASLEEIHLPEELQKIGERAFGNCSSLKVITVPPKLSLMALDTARFYGLDSLEKIVFEEGREKIIGYAFFDTTTNVEIRIPKSVKEFSSYPFFIHGAAKFVFLGDCPEIIETTDFYGDPTIYYDPNTSGWDTCLWKDKYPLIPVK